MVHFGAMGLKVNVPMLSGLEPLLSIEEFTGYHSVPTRTRHDWFGSFGGAPGAVVPCGGTT